MSSTLVPNDLSIHVNTLLILHFKQRVSYIHVYNPNLRRFCTFELYIIIIYNDFKKYLSVSSVVFVSFRKMFGFIWYVTFEQIIKYTNLLLMIGSQLVLLTLMETILIFEIFSIVLVKPWKVCWSSTSARHEQSNLLLGYMEPL